MSISKRWQGVMLVLSFIGMTATGCSSSYIPSDADNICSIFQEKDDWYAAAHKVHADYGVPIHIAMAIMHQDSKFQVLEDAQNEWFLLSKEGQNIQEGGYILVNEDIWNEYSKEEGSVFTSRESFIDSLDFIAWFMRKANAEAQIPLKDAYHQYLCYHEGIEGYRQGSYQSKAWLVKTAQEVAERAELYRKQLLHCQIY